MFLRLRLQALLLSIASCALFSAAYAAEIPPDAPVPERENYGVRPLTPEEEIKDRAQSVVITEIRYNTLALQRMVQAGLDSNGAGAQAPRQAVPFGMEIVGVVGGEPMAMAAPDGAGQLIGDAPLPAAVDNSQLPCFPPIRSQGATGSCTSFSSVYYQATHMMGLVRGWDQHGSEDSDDYRFSVAWAYNMINGGYDAGANISTNLRLLIDHGVTTQSRWPHSGYLAWSTDPAVWRNALNYRFNQRGYLGHINTPDGMHQLKQVLLNGYVVTFDTFVNSWEQRTVGDDPGTAADDPFVGQKICRQRIGNSGAHAMTMVGYNDDIWLDINNNGVVDPGEKGALKIANSWGGNDWNGGYRWLAYDALYDNSQVAGWTQATYRRAAVSGDNVQWIAPTPNHTPRLIAEFEVSHNKRRYMGISLGRSDLTTTLDEASGGVHFTALYGNGGEYNFKGTTSTLPADCRGTFQLEYINTVAPVAGVPQRYWLGVRDFSSGGSETATLHAFRLLDEAGNVLAEYTGGEHIVDDDTAWFPIEYTYDPGDGLPTLSVAAVDDSASESGNDPGVFRITRTGSLVDPLGVNFLLSGTATEGNDYIPIGAATTIPAGAASVDVTILPIEDGIDDFDEAVHLTLAEGFGYTVGSPDTATVVIDLRSDAVAFSQQPSDVTLHSATDPPIQVTILDDLGDPITDSTVPVTLSLGSNPGGATLLGTTTVNAVDGIATFRHIGFDQAGSGYTLLATSLGLSSSVTSDAFTVANGPTLLATDMVFTVQPSDIGVNDTINPAVEVTIRDQNGDPLTLSDAAVTVTCWSNRLGRNIIERTVNAVNGVATFPALTHYMAGTYTLVASTDGVADATSAAFEIIPGAATSFSFATQPSDTGSGLTMTPAVEVSLIDDYGNVATGSTAAVTLAIGDNPAGGTLSGTTTVNAVAGIATFTDLSIDQIGDDYTLTAASPGLPTWQPDTTVSSATFSIATPSPAVAAALHFDQQPTGATEGGTITPAVTVQVLDQYGDPITSTIAVTLAIDTNPAGGSLSGTTTVTAVGGVATFADLSIDHAGSGYSLAATATGLTGDTSALFDISVAGPDITSDLVLHHAYDESYGSSAVDSSVNGLDGSLSGGTSWQSAGGLIAGALAVDGIDGLVGVDNSPLINEAIHGKRSISLWFKADDPAPTTQQVLYEEGGVMRGLAIYLADGEIRVFGWNDDASQSDWGGTLHTAAVSADTWYHVVLVLDGGSTLTADAFSAWLDGVEIGSGPGSQLWEHSGNIGFGGINAGVLFADGSSPDTGHHFAGLLDDARIYNRALDAADIAALFALGSTVTPTIQPSVGSLIVDEGGSADFTVTLSEAPAASVEVSVAHSSGDSDLSVSSGAILSFSTANWNVAQTVSLAAASDTDMANGSAQFTLSATGLDDVTVTATENDTTPPQRRVRITIGDPKQDFEILEPVLAPAGVDDGNGTLFEGLDCGTDHRLVPMPAVSNS